MTADFYSDPDGCLHLCDRMNTPSNDDLRRTYYPGIQNAGPSANALKWAPVIPILLFLIGGWLYMRGR